MKYFIIKVVVLLMCFILAFYMLSALDLERFFKKGKTTQAQLLYLGLCMALAYLMAEFIFSICAYFYL